MFKALPNYLKFTLAEHSPLVIINRGESAISTALPGHGFGDAPFPKDFLKLVFVSNNASPGSLPGGAFSLSGGDAD